MFYFDGGIFAVLSVLIDEMLSCMSCVCLMAYNPLIINNVNILL